MKKTQPDNLQFVFACLITHSKWIYLVREDYQLLMQFFTLSDYDYHLFYCFMQTNFDKLLTSALLAEEKRWREMLTAIPYTVSTFYYKKLKNYWEQYLKSISLIEFIPATPIHESINFLVFLLKHPLDLAIRPIVEYEYSRNVTRAFDISPEQKDNYTKFNHINLTIAELPFYQAQLNPSFITNEYHTALTKILAADTSDASPDYIGFFKHLQTGKAVSLFLNNSSFTLLNSIPSHPSLSSLIHWLNHAAHLDPAHAIKAIKKFHKDSIILLTHLA